MSGITTSAVLNTSNTLHAREVDFVTRFTDNWDALRQIMGIMRPIRKSAGTRLVSYTAEMVDAALVDNTTEGADINFTQFKVKENSYEDITIHKYGKAVTLEAVAKYGAQVAIEKTDDQFLVELQNKTMNDFYTFMLGGKLQGTYKTFQKTLAMAKAAVLNKFSGMSKTVTEIVGFVNVNDLYAYLGDAAITVQSAFGIQYIKDFLGYNTIFLLPDNILAQKKVIAIPVENIDMYYVDPADSDFAKMGLVYTAQGETSLIGFRAEGNYRNATGESYAITGIKLWAEFIDGIAIGTIGSTETAFKVVSE